MAKQYDYAEMERQDNYRFWLKYREGPPGAPRPTSIPAGWRKTPYKSKPRSTFFQGYNKFTKPAKGPESPVPIYPYLKYFLRRKVPEFNEPQEWKGVKILGQGSFGTVGLFKHTGTSSDFPNLQYVAVKEASTADDWPLTDEAKAHWALEQGNSQHIVKLLKEPSKAEEKVVRMLLEYLPLGSLEGVLDMRASMGKPFHEITLWYFFKCLVDGLIVMSFGREGFQNNISKSWVANKREENWKEWVHFDLKPHNILLGNRTTDHTITPVLKLADFGLAAEVEEDDQTERGKRRKLSQRPVGTEGYYTPEQFTARFDFADFEKDGFSGVSTTKSNIFQIGCIMWRLILLTKGTIPPMIPYFPGNDIPGWKPVGKTYGKKMKDVPYSAELRKTIFECLYEMPANRPELLTLRARIEEAFKTARLENPDFKGEPWDEFDPPGPEKPEWDPDAPDDIDPIGDPAVRVPLARELQDAENAEEELFARVISFWEKRPATRSLLDGVLKKEEARLKDFQDALKDNLQQQFKVMREVQNLRKNNAPTVDIEQRRTENPQKFLPQQRVIETCIQPVTAAIAKLVELLENYDKLPAVDDETPEEDQKTDANFEAGIVNQLQNARNETVKLLKRLAEFDNPVLYVEPPPPSKPPTPPSPIHTSQTGAQTGKAPLTPPPTPPKPQVIVAEYISIQPSGIPTPDYEYDPKQPHIERIFLTGNFGVEGLIGHIPINTSVNQLRAYISWLVKEKHIPPVIVNRFDLKLTLHPATKDENEMTFGTMTLYQLGMQKDRQYTILAIDRTRVVARPKAFRNTKINIVNGKAFNMNIDLDMKISDLRHAVYAQMKKKVQAFFSFTPETMDFRILVGGKKVRLDDGGRTLGSYGVTMGGKLMFYLEERGRKVRRLTNSWNERQKRKYNPYS